MWGLGLLSLIPHLIERLVGRWVGGVWVWLGGTLLLLVLNLFRSVVAGGLARCWVLRRHSFFVGVFLVPLLAWPSNAQRVFMGLRGGFVWWRWWVRGVVVC